MVSEIHIQFSALELIERILTKMDTNDVPINIFLDLSKAFDTIDQTILQNKLAYYGLNGSALQLFKNYLQNRKQYTMISSLLCFSGTVYCGLESNSSNV